MKKYKSSFHSSRLFLFGIIVVGFIYLGGNVWSSNKTQKNTLRINNRTKSCQVIGAEKHNSHVKLTLRNDSEKNITAFVISSVSPQGDIFTVTEEFAYSEIDFVIAPGN